MPSIDSHPADHHARSRMLAGSGKRIAWFLALRHILQFPTYPMAPLRVSFPLRRPGASENDSASSIVGPRLEPWLMPLRFHQTLAPLASVSIRGRNFARAGVATIHAEVATTHAEVATAHAEVATTHAGVATRVIRSAPQSDLPWLPAVIANQQPTASGKTVSNGASPVSHTPPALFLGPNSPDPRQSHQNLPISQIYQLGSGTGFSPAPVHGALVDRGFPGHEPWRPPIALDRANDMWRDTAVSPSGSETESDNRLLAKADLDSPGSNQLTSEDPSRSRGPCSSTLHLDGSALGQWAMDHLERALSKPATGMTGVDPRATIPRSRVSPF